ILKNIIDKRAEDWGIEVSAVEVKDVDLPPEMKRAIARQAEAERERRAKVINAEGELQASEKLAQAAHIIGSEPAAIQLRYLRKALLEERTRPLIEERGGVLGWLVGPGRLSAQRVVSGEPAAVERALDSWMQQEELLQVKRRYPDHTSWEPKVGAFASIQR